MKIKLLATAVFLCTFVMGQNSFAQTNRERKTERKEVEEAYFTKDKKVHCPCGTEIATATFKIGEVWYECPNPKCRCVWAQSHHNGIFGKLHFRHKNPIKHKKEELPKKHECGKSCVTIIPDKNNNTIVIRRTGTCNEPIYIAFPYVRRNFLLPSNCKEDGFIDEYGIIESIDANPTRINAFITNDKNDFHKRYGNNGYIK